MPRIPTSSLLDRVEQYILDQVLELKGSVYTRLAPADALKAGGVRCLITAIPANVESPLQRTWRVLLTVVLTSDRETLAVNRADDVYGAITDSGSQDRGRNELPRDDDYDIKTVTPVAVIDPRPPREKGKRLFEFGLQFEVEMEAR